MDDWRAGRCTARVKLGFPRTPVDTGFLSNNARGSFPPCGSLLPSWGPNMRRVSVPQLLAIADDMSPRDRAITETVARLSLVSGRQLSNIFFSNIPHPSTRARLARRVLARLVEQGVLARLQRRQGGIGGGSQSWVYALGPAGRRIVAYWAGEGLPRSRSVYEPAAAWFAHTLAVSDLYVQLRQAERAGRVEVLTFDAEPACHRRYTRLGGVTGVLKPDAFVRLGIGDYEDALMVEVDLGTERRGQLLRQHAAYSEHFRAGIEQANTGIYPGVLWIVPDAKRAALLADIQRKLPEQTRRLFTVATSEQALDVLCGQASGGES